jgi:KaiC/GvpD/RAD55 family RecA-like ATPase/ribosomal protein L37AE/L43A
MNKYIDCTDNTANATEKPSFSILNHLDKLEPTKIKNKYICPVCGGNDLSIAKTGAYQCWHGCEVKDIREALAPWDQREKSSKSSKTGSKVPKKKTKISPCPLPSEPVNLALLPEIPTDIPQLVQRDIPEFLQKQGVPSNALTKIYKYSETQMIKRYQWEDDNQPKGYSKTIRPWHLNDGQFKMGKGCLEWDPYRLEEAMVHGQNKWIIGVEGENCVEDARSLGLAAITYQGASWGEVELGTGLGLLNSGGVNGMVFISDADETGDKKTKALLEASGKVKFPVLIISSSKLWEECPNKGDISDWIQWGKEQGMNKEDFIRRLEEEIHRTLAEHRQEQTNKSPNVEDIPYGDLSPDEQLEWDIKSYVNASTNIRKKRLKGEICSRYRISKQDFMELVEEEEAKERTPEKTNFSLNEFLALNTDKLRWIIPGLLPLGETILLAAPAKTGKSLLACDIAYSVLSGDYIVGEKPGVTGKVLLVSSDESPNSTKRRLLARGFDLLANAGEQLRIMTHLNLGNLTELEKHLEDFKPQLVIIDSLTSISRDLGISENDAEYAKGIYRLKEVIGRYGSSGILIHHENKDKDAKGINKVAGSARIVASVWGIAQLVSAKPNDDKCTTRLLRVKPREGESMTLSLDINPKDLWASQGIFNFLGELGDKNQSQRTYAERVMELLAKHSGQEMEYQEMNAYLNIGRSLYTVLDRLEDRQFITKRRSEIDKRRWVYSLSVDSTKNDNSTNVQEEKIEDSPPPSEPDTAEVEMSETLNIQEIEVDQKLVNTEVEINQQAKNENMELNEENIDDEKVSEKKELIQQQADTEGGRVSANNVEVKKNVVQDEESQ